MSEIKPLAVFNYYFETIFRFISSDESAQKDALIESRFGNSNFEKEPLQNKKLKKTKLKSIDGDCGKFITPINSASVCSNSE